MIKIKNQKKSCTQFFNLYHSERPNEYTYHNWGKACPKHFYSNCILI